MKLRTVLALTVSAVLLVAAAHGGATRSQACADPSGNCGPNGGLVTFSTPPPAGPAQQPCADPSGNCGPGGGLVTFATPPPPAGPPQQPCADPSGNCPPANNPPGGNACGACGNQPVQNGANPGFAISVSPAEASIGDTVTVTGQGFSALGKGGVIYLNLVSADGAVVDTRIAPISCTVTTNSIFYLYVVGCGADGTGATIQSTADGTFVAAVTIPDAAETGAQQLCANSNFINPICTPITIDP